MADGRYFKRGKIANEFVAIVTCYCYKQLNSNTSRILNFNKTADIMEKKTAVYTTKVV